MFSVHNLHSKQLLQQMVLFRLKIADIGQRKTHNW